MWFVAVWHMRMRVRAMRHAPRAMRHAPWGHYYVCYVAHEALPNCLEDRQAERCAEQSRHGTRGAPERVVPRLRWPPVVAVRECPACRVGRRRQQRIALGLAERQLGVE